MSKKSFKAESKRLLDLMIHSIYTNKEIFLRELISNASDALDKRYYQVLSDENSSFDKENFYIRIEADKEKRTLTIRDTGIGMTKDELESNLGTIARSGSLDFKANNQPKDGVEIIGQFGVGFYSAFMVADNVKVQSRAVGSEEVWEWYSEGADGYTLNQSSEMEPGTIITLTLKNDTEEEKYSEYLEDYRLKSLIKKHSDFIKHPIRMEITRKVPKKDNEKEFEEKIEDETLNNMVPIWRKNKNELKDEDYDNFYTDKHFGFEKPLRHIHLSLDGAVSCAAILYIPARTPYDFYTKEYQKGLELYSNGVMIMAKCGDLLPDYFSFVQGIVDSPDLSLNISRELLQHDHQLKLIAKHIQNKIKSELMNMLNNDRETYEYFFKNFGRQLKYGLYTDWGMHKDILQDLLLFYSSTENKLVTLKEYISRMKENQKAIYYAAGETNEKLSKLPQTERLSDKGYEILYFTDEVDEFAIQALREYEKKSFKNVSSGDLDLENGEKPVETEEQKTVFEAVKKELGDKVSGVRASARLKSHPACIATEGGISVEMEKALSHMPDNKGIKAQKFLEINTNHPVYLKLENANKNGDNTFGAMARVLYNQALLIEGLTVEDPIAFSNDIWEVIKK